MSFKPVSQIKYDKLNKELTDKLPLYKEEYKNIAFSTEPANKERAEEYIQKLYNQKNKGTLKFTWCKSPKEAMTKVSIKNFKTSDPSPQQINEMVNKIHYGSMDAFWISTFSFIAYEMGHKIDDSIDYCNEIIKDAWCYWVFDDSVDGIPECIISEKPNKIHVKDNVLHNTEGQAIEWEDSTGICLMDGKAYASLLEAAIGEKFQERKDD